MPSKVTRLLTLSIIVTSLDANTQEIALGFNTLAKEGEKMIALNTCSFLELISKGTFVDKSLLMDAIVHKSARISVINSPTGWGKSVNMDMLRIFFGMPLHPNGTKVLPISDTSNYKLFKRGEYTFDGFNIKLNEPLLISNDKYAHLIDQHLGQYPVIYLSFDNISFIDENDPKAILKEVIIKAFEQHKYMLDVYDRIIAEDRVDVHYLTERGEFSAYLDGEKDDVFFGLSYLTKYLHDHFQRKVIILIDKFNRFLKTESKEISKFLQHTLLFNKYVERAILTDILPMWLMELENHNYTVYENTLLRPFYGFTMEEMNLLFHHFQIPIEEQNMIRYWYGGYKSCQYWHRGHKSLTSALPERFNPRSVTNYIVTLQLKPYLVFSSSEIFKLLIFQYNFILLILGDWCLIPYREEGLITERLIASGYFIKTGILHHYLHDVDNNIKIPNFEIASQLQRSYAHMLDKIYGKKSSKRLATTSSKWELYLLSDECKSRILEINMQKCFQFVPKYFNKTYSSISIKDSILETLIFTMVMSTLWSEKLHCVGWHFKEFQKHLANETIMPSEMLLSSKTRGIIINIQYGNDNQSAVDHISRYSKMLQEYAKFHQWNDIKVVNCKFISYKQVEIAGMVQPMDLNSS